MNVELTIKKKDGTVEKYGPQNKYDQHNTTQIKLKLNKKTDADLLEWLEGLDNKQGTIKEILRQHIADQRFDDLLSEKLTRAIEESNE